jgi:hypothetical protein
VNNFSLWSIGKKLLIFFFKLKDKGSSSKNNPSQRHLKALKFSNPGSKASGLQSTGIVLGKRIIKKQNKFDSKNEDTK